MTKVLWETKRGRVGVWYDPFYDRAPRVYDLISRYTWRRPWAQLLWEPRDLWVGVYWTPAETNWRWSIDVYVCIVPCLPLRIMLRGGGNKPWRSQ